MRVKTIKHRDSTLSLVIRIESKEEFRSLYHRINLNPRIVNEYKSPDQDIIERPNYFTRLTDLWFCLFRLKEVQWH